MPTLELSAPTNLSAADLRPRGEVFPSPADWRDQTLYFLLPDRFSDGNGAQRPLFDRGDPERFRAQDKRAWMEAGKGFQGGTLKGIASIIDGVFDGSGVCQAVLFRPAAALTPQALAPICEQVRVRVLRWFARTGLLEHDDVREMLAWKNGGFSLDAQVRIAARDRAALERLLRYCARPPFALERLDLIDEQRVIYRLPRAQRDGSTALLLTPLELIDHLAAQIPPPRLRRHRYHGVLASNSLPSLPAA